MVKQQKIQSFFKRKRDEDGQEDTSGPDCLAMVVFGNQRDEDGQAMQDEEEQENPLQNAMMRSEERRVGKECLL